MKRLFFLNGKGSHKMGVKSKQLFQTLKQGINSNSKDQFKGSYDRSTAKELVKICVSPLAVMSEQTRFVLGRITSNPAIE